MIKGFAHVCLAATDLDAVEHFYCAGLGLQKAFHFIRDGRVVGFYLQLRPGSYVEVFERDGIDPEAKELIQHFCLETDDIDAVSTRLQQAGYDVTEKKRGADGSWQAWTADSTGVKIEFHQYTERSAQVTREDCALD